MVTGEPLTGSPYRYAANNSPNMTDATGLDPEALMFGNGSSLDNLSAIGDGVSLIGGMAPHPIAQAVGFGADLMNLGIGGYEFYQNPSIGAGFAIVGDGIGIVPGGGELVGSGVKYVGGTLVAAAWVSFEVPQSFKKWMPSLLSLGMEKAKQGAGGKLTLQRINELSGYAASTVTQWHSKCGHYLNFFFQPWDINWENITRLYMDQAEHIYFMLDDLVIDWSKADMTWKDGNFTVSELMHVLNNPKLLEKTTFLKEGVEVDASEVMSLTAAP